MMIKIMADGDFHHRPFYKLMIGFIPWKEGGHFHQT